MTRWFVVTYNLNTAVGGEDKEAYRFRFRVGGSNGSAEVLLLCCESASRQYFAVQDVGGR